MYLLDLEYEIEKILFKASDQNGSESEVSDKIIRIKIDTNKPIKQFLKAVSNSIFKLTFKKVSEAQKVQEKEAKKELVIETIKKTLEQWKPLLTKFTTDKDDFLPIDCLYVDQRNYQGKMRRRSKALLQYDSSSALSKRNNHKEGHP